jgi:hypothetical protein
MRVVLTLFLTAFFLIGSRAQEKKWSAELHYPISAGESFGSSNQGVIGAGLGYRFASFGKTTLGASLEATWFATTIINDSDPIQESKYRDFFLQPRLFVEHPLTPNKRLILRAGLGWTFQQAQGPAFVDSAGQVQGENLNSGPNLNAGLLYNLTPRWYLLGQYDLFFLSGDSPSRTIGLLKFGGGVRF